MAGVSEFEKQIAWLADLTDEQAAAFAHLCDRVKEPNQVALQTSPLADGYWQVTIVAADRVGVLSIFNGMFTSHQVDIVSGDAIVYRPPAQAVPPPGIGRHGFRPHPLRQPKPAPQLAKVIATFKTLPNREVDASFWEKFEHDLEHAFGLFANHDLNTARETFIEFAVKAAFDYRVHQEQSGELPPDAGSQVELKTTPSDGERPAKLWVRAADTRGILFELTSALALLNVNIERLRIRTVDGRVRDTVWITDARRRNYTDESRLSELRESATLILQFMRLLARTPNPEQALEQFVQLTEDLVSRRDGVAVQSLESEQVLRTLAQVLGSSRFLWDDFLRMRHECLFPVIIDLPIEKRRFKKDLEAELSSLLKQSDSFAERIDALNRWKDRELFRVDLRHLMRKVDVSRFADELSDLAEVTIDHACRIAHRHLEKKYGRPSVNGRDCRWCVFGLGKLGGRELGYASDIELLFVYEDQGKTNGPEQLFNSDYFERFVCDFLRTVQAKRDGIFEVDLRLRPYGSAGSNACSLSAFRNYFRTGGEAEQFQRLALVKMRLIAGDPDLAREILRASDEYVYSDQPIDYNEIYRLRRMQCTQLVPKGEISAKHSPGGLVDIEYFVQSLQIESGRHQPKVRVTSTRRAIKRLTAAGFLPPALAHDLLETYNFMRRLIDALRVVRGHAKDLSLPPENSRSYAYLAKRMQYDHSELLEAQIHARMAFISKIWKFIHPEHP